MEKKVLKLPERKLSKEENDIFRIGFEMGKRHSIDENQDSIKIGDAILAVLDSRYEFKEEDY